MLQCFASSQFCDGQVECVNGDDEGDCISTRELRSERYLSPLPPAVIDFVKNGTTIFTRIETEDKGQQLSSVICPETHYQCAHNGYCLPTFTLCNDLFDCPDHEDEADCDSYTCPGHYRCFDSKICLHPQQVCDGIYQCPQSDDELLCDLHCPQGCTCHGLAFICTQNFPVSKLPELRYLDHVTGPGFQPMVKLQTLNMIGCPMTEINKEILHGMNQLQTMYSDNYKLCCAASLVKNTINCQAPQNEISSCQDLLRSNMYRVVLGVFNSLALIGNGVSFIFRLSSLRSSGSPGFSVFVLHLCLSDFLMGVYLAVIGLADRLYKNVYVWQDTSWRHSVTCKLAGFLSLMSCEVSAFIICLITLDRFLVVRFPLSFLHFRGWNAQLASCLSWMVGFILSVIPFIPAAAHWQFYSQTGICIPLPVTRKQFAGQTYSFGIMIVLNFVLFIVIAVGQGAIYWSIRSNTMQGGQSTQRSQDTSIARRLFTVAMSDFFCWFPIGLLGLLASLGVPVSGELNVVMAIIVMPLNSALNPFLYTLNLILQKREKKKEEQLLKWLESQK
ncbi:hypothetical protein ACOMHN_023786 [Nucella lapillus]